MGCSNSIVVNAPIDQVWALLRNFHDLSWASGVVEGLEVVGEAGPFTVGAKRIINGTFHETLMTLDDLDRVVRYSIDDGPGTPVSKDTVSSYVGVVRAFPVTATNQTFVLWTSSWQDSQGGVAEFCDPIYKALLEALSKQLA